MTRNIILLMFVLFVSGCSTTAKDRTVSNVEGISAVAALGNTPGAAAVGIVTTVYDFLREKPSFKRSDGLNSIIVKRVPGFAMFYRRALDKFKSGDLMGDGAQRALNEKEYEDGKRLYLSYAESGQMEVVFSIIKGSNAVDVMTLEEANSDKKVRAR